MDDLRNFQTTCRVDEGVEVHEITEVADPSNTDPDGCTVGPPDGWELIALDLSLADPLMTRDDVIAAANHAAGQPPLRDGIAACWVRAYCPTTDPAAPALALFAAPAGVVDTCADLPGRHRVVEVTPEEYR